MEQITIQLDSSWVLSNRNADILPVPAIAEFLQKELGIKVKEQSFTELIADTVKPVQFKTLQKQILSFLCEKYHSTESETASALDISVSSVEAPAKENEPTDPEQQEQDKPTTETTPPKPAPIDAAPKDLTDTQASEAEKEAPKPKISALEKIRAFRGGTQLAALCEEIHAIAPFAKAKQLERLIVCNNYIFSIDSGYGYTTALSLFQDFLQEEDVFHAKDKPAELILEAESPRSDPLEDMASQLRHTNKKIVSIDISNWSDKLATPAFRDFLRKINDRSEENIFIFKLPFIEQRALNQAAVTISDVMRIRALSFVPLTARELQEIVSDRFTAQSFTVSEEAWDLFQQRIAEEKADGRFYGVKTAYKVADEMLYLKLCAVAHGKSQDDNRITAQDLQAFSDVSRTAKTAEEQFAELVGIDKIRDNLLEIVNQIEYARKNSGVESPAMHMRFIGSPGTGKTTVARILGQMLKERGILSRGYFFEHAGSDFIGMYVGHTAPKTLALCRDAYGSVMFIDEAYTISDASYNNGDGYGKEAIDTLIAQMENHRDDMVVIMAGYPREMNELMALNPGLAGRMPYVLEFPNYDRKELCQIFEKMVQDSTFELTPELQETARSFFDELEDSIIQAADFANARFVRNLFERAWSKTITRSQLDGSDPHIITVSDFSAAAAEIKADKNNGQSKRTRTGYRLGLI